LRLLGAISPRIRDDLEEAAFAADTLRGVLTDCDQLVVKILQGLSEPRLPWGINSELGDLSGELIGRGHCVNEHLLSFQRYNLWLDKDPVPNGFGVAIPEDELPTLHAIDNADMVPRLHELAAQAAAMQVSGEDFARFLPRAKERAVVAETAEV
jgi:hypothetical protein